MGTHRNAAFTALAVLLTVACSAAPGEADRNATAAATGAREELPSLYGRWRIVALNGTPPRSIGSDPRSRPSIEFAPDRYRGSTGCNSFTGAGLLSGGRWFGETPLQTEQGCGDLTRQEEAVIGIVSGGPAVAFEGGDVATLTAAKGTLHLRREGASAAPSVRRATDAAGGNALDADGRERRLGELYGRR